MYDVLVKSSRSLSHLLMSFLYVSSSLLQNKFSRVLRATILEVRCCLTSGVALNYWVLFVQLAFVCKILVYNVKHCSWTIYCTGTRCCHGPIKMHNLTGQMQFTGHSLPTLALSLAKMGCVWKQLHLICHCCVDKWFTAGQSFWVMTGCWRKSS